MQSKLTNQSMQLKTELIVINVSRKKKVSIQGQEKNNKMSNSVSQSKMNTEPKVVSTQTTISSTVAVADFKPQQSTPDHKTYVNDIRKELNETSTGVPKISPGHNGHVIVVNKHNSYIIK